MKPALVPSLASVVVAAVFAWPTTTADAKSEKQVFAEVARSVVVLAAEVRAEENWDEAH